VYPKSRIDALTDGLFAVAMTILVLDVRLPEALHGDPHTLSLAFRDVWTKFFPYALSFYMLGTLWLSNTRLGSKSEFVDRRYVSWWLAYLLIATCLPFSTSVVGRFAQLPPAVWVYSANMAALGVVGYRLVVLQADQSESAYVFTRKLALAFQLVTALLSIPISLISPRGSLFVYALNLLEPRLARRFMASRGISHDPAA
jgi:uncharacterized membrane protein